jgi:hypothetical protein
MSEKIYVVDGDDRHTLSETEYEAEARLQTLLGSHPYFLSDDLIDEPNSRQGLLLANRT